MNDVITIPISKIDSFKNHPFKVNNDDSLKELKESIRTNGLLNPLIVRKKDDDRYELISGHRRKLAMELIGIKEAKVIVKDLTDDEAIVEMVDSNIYREKILPSEKVFAYKMKYDAIKHQGKFISFFCPIAGQDFHFFFIKEMKQRNQQMLCILMLIMCFLNLI